MKICLTALEIIIKIAHFFKKCQRVLINYLS